MADDGRIVVYALLGLGFGAYSFYRGLIRRKDRQLIENTPTSKVRAIAMGPVEVYGEALQPKNIKLKAPFTGKDCVYYRCTIEEYRRSGKSSHWVTIHDESKHDFFYLRDNTGTVLIDPGKAEIDIPVDFEYKGSGANLPKGIASYMTATNLSPTGFFGFGKELRFREWHIAPKDKLYIFGEAKDNPFVDDNTAKKSEENIMIAKGRHFYYISDKPEKEVLKSFRWKIIGGLYGGAALILGCLFIIFLYFRIL